MNLAWCVLYGVLGAPPTPVSIHVDASGLDPLDRAPMEHRIRETATGALTRTHVPIAPSASRRLEVAVRHLSIEDGRYVYTVRITGGDASERALGGDYVCDLCTLTTLLDAIEAKLSTVAADLAGAPPPAPRPSQESIADDGSVASASAKGDEDHPRPPDLDRAPAQPDAVDPVTHAPSASTPPSSRRVRPLGWAGVGIGAAGISSVIVGAVFLARGRVIHVSQNDRDGVVDDYRPLGHAFFWPGVAATVTGAVLLGLGASRRRSATLAWWVPSLGARSAALVAGGRF